MLVIKLERIIDFVVEKLHPIYLIKVLTCEVRGGRPCSLVIVLCSRARYSTPVESLSAKENGGSYNTPDHFWKPG